MKTLNSVLLNAVVAAGVGPTIYLDDQKQKNLLIFIRGTGAAIGTVVIETQDPSGTWFPIHSETFSAAAQPDPISVSGIPISVIRANITAYTSGTFYAGVKAN